MTWEITAGKNMPWKTSRHWWVMTWIVNGSSRQSSFSPIPVMYMDSDVLLVPYAPYHAVKFGDSTKIAGHAGDRMYYILPENIWARMPLEIPAVPNVEMFFQKLPNGLALPLTKE